MHCFSVMVFLHCQSFFVRDLSKKKIDIFVLVSKILIILN